MWSSGRSDLAALEAQLPAPLQIRPIASARRLRLRFDEATGAFRLTCPSRMSRRAALRWALDQRGWMEGQLANALPPEPFAPGATILLHGQEIRIDWHASSPRTPQLTDGTLLCGGPEQGLAQRIERFLKRVALDTMSAEVADYAARAGTAARAVSIGDPASRWGSCTSGQRIRLSWRLILAPEAVRRYVVAHEVAHLVHLNHGPEFKALEAKLFGPGVAEAKSLLRRIGPRLRRIGRLV